MSSSSGAASSKAQGTRFRKHDGKDRSKGTAKGAKAMGGAGKAEATSFLRGDDQDGPAYLDKGDPNYCPDEDEEGIVLVSSGRDSLPPGSPKREAYDPEGGGGVPPAMSLAGDGSPHIPDLAAFKLAVIDIVTEYFASDTPEEVARALLELRAPRFHYEFVKRAISMAMDRGSKEREMVSRLLSFLYEKPLSTDEIGQGFERLFEVVDDLAIDIPAAKTILSQFLSRAVVDELLPPSFLADPAVQGAGDEVVEQSMRKLSLNHGTVRIEKVWGPGDGRPVEELKQALDQLLLEFLSNGDTAEATRCVHELATPHFHHELVKRAVVNAMDKGAGAQASMSGLLKHLAEQQLLSTEQTVQGFQRLIQIIDELILDTPSAKAVLSGFLERAVADELLPPSLDFAWAPSAAAAGVLPESISSGSIFTSGGGAGAGAADAADASGASES